MEEGKWEKGMTDEKQHAIERSKGKVRSAGTWLQITCSASLCLRR